MFFFPFLIVDHLIAVCFAKMFDLGIGMGGGVTC